MHNFMNVFTNANGSTEVTYTEVQENHDLSPSLGGAKAYTALSFTADQLREVICAHGVPHDYHTPCARCADFNKSAASPPPAGHFLYCADCEESGVARDLGNRAEVLCEGCFAEAQHAILMDYWDDGHIPSWEEHLERVRRPIPLGEDVALFPCADCGAETDGRSLCETCSAIRQEGMDRHNRAMAEYNAAQAAAPSPNPDHGWCPVCRARRPFSAGTPYCSAHCDWVEHQDVDYHGVILPAYRVVHHEACPYCAQPFEVLEGQDQPWCYSCDLGQRTPVEERVCVTCGSAFRTVEDSDLLSCHACPTVTSSEAVEWEVLVEEARDRDADDVAAFNAGLGWMTAEEAARENAPSYDDRYDF